MIDPKNNKKVIITKIILENGIYRTVDAILLFYKVRKEKKDMPVSQESLRSALGEIMQDSKIQEEKYAQIITTQEQRDETAMPERLMILIPGSW